MGEFRPVPDVLAYLAGSWRVQRSVRDRASGDEGRFDGITVFSALEEGGPGHDGLLHKGLPHDGLPHNGLLHEESGTFVWLGVARPAERTLRFLPGPTAGTADVRFADGRPFHDLDLTSGRHIADHPCSADLYQGEFTALGADRWRTLWRVAGPAKDLLLITDYMRVG
ncbi:DUF6314 family protein [Streptomyces sp900129855]|uniref:DUF6314 family protein n=1 Tax=Streptomyces sp. 900129855 TaxID=3155129 RepID=A0ABV2ZDV7_9ACTN